MNFKTFLKDHTADILEVIGIAGFAVSEVALIDAAQKEYRDGDKKHYILPVASSIGSAAFVVMSGAQHHAIEAGMAGVIAMQTKQIADQRKLLGDDISNEKLYEIDSDEAQKYYQSDDGVKNDNLKEYWMKDFGIKIQIDPWRIEDAEKDANEQFHDVGYVSLYDILAYMELESPAYDRFKVQSITYSLDPNEDYYDQGIQLIRDKVMIDGKVVETLTVYRYCGDILNKWD